MISPRAQNSTGLQLGILVVSPTSLGSRGLSGCGAGDI